MEALPRRFIEMLSSLPGHEGVAQALTTEVSPISIRLNPLKPVDCADLSADIVPWEPNGRYLSERPQFTFHPGLYAGCFYVQDASSMITSEAIRRIIGDSSEPLLYLDACAAPGGKTTAALSVLPRGSFVLANEYAPDRCKALIENLERWGTGAYAVSRDDARNLGKIDAFFDIAAIDVPCSGEGMMRKNETAVTQWSEGLIESCAALQRQIADSVYEAVKPGGYLIYSTCTFNTKENEDNIRYIRDSLGAEPVDLRLDDFPGVLPGLDPELPSARFLPGKVRGEGQFIAVFRKPEADEAPRLPRLASPKKAQRLPDWLNGDFTAFAGKDGDLYAVPTQRAPFVSHLARTVNLVSPGMHCASTKGRDLVPAHGLATNVALRKDAFPAVEVDYPTAILFLRGETIKLSDGTPRGIVLLTHEGHSLGWAKNIGSRANNLVPASRRIRSDRKPDVKPVLK